MYYVYAFQHLCYKFCFAKNVRCKLGIFLRKSLTEVTTDATSQHPFALSDELF